MAVAVGAARSVLGNTAPNPPVGAVLVCDGKQRSICATRPVGGPHAEVVALEEAGSDARGGTLFVTLEPCCHQGRTPPCTEAVLASGLRRVVVGVLDPFPLVDGRGVSLLRAAGLTVDVGVGAVACERLILGFRRALAEGLPEIVGPEESESSLDAVVTSELRDCVAMTLVLRSPRLEVDPKRVAAVAVRELVVWCDEDAPEVPQWTALRANGREAMLRALVSLGRHRVRLES